MAVVTAGSAERTRGQSCDVWQQVAVAPVARNQHSMAYDSARGVLVLFGGYTGGRTNETWEYDGTGWTRRNVSGPSPRIQAGMVYDSQRGVCVLFGGDIGPPNGETWEWDGTAWTRRFVAGPSPRYRHGMVYDSDRHVTVLFGGYNGTLRNNETWEWDGTEWTQRQIPAPSVRSTPAMAYDSSRHRAVLFGGYTGTVYYAETWEYDGAAWSQRQVSGPSARALACAAFDPVRNVMVMFGGSVDGPEFSDTWEWDGSGDGAWTQRPSGSVTGRASSAMVYDTARHLCVMVGGSNGLNLLGDTNEWDGAAWQTHPPASPPSRTATAMAFDSGRGATVLFGGQGGALALLNDTWEHDGEGWVQLAAAGPSARSGHALAYDSTRGVTVLFGGSDAVGLSAATWEWNGTAWTQAPPPTPPATAPTARTGHAMAFDRDRNVTVLFGGTTVSGPSDETWEWDGAARAARAAAGPSGRSGHAMAYDRERHVAVLFGGTAGGPPSGETWEWDGQGAGTWTHRTVAGPSARSGAAMAWDVARARVLLYGGLTGTGASAETWEWDGQGAGAWTQRTVSGPGVRTSHAVAYDSARSATVLFGGFTAGGPSGEMWRFLAAAPPLISQQPVDWNLCPGQSATLSVAATGTGTLGYQWRHGGTNLVNGGSISGATTPTLTINPLVAGDSGTYDVVVTSACGSSTSAPATIAVGTPTAITQQPSPVTAAPGGQALFTVGASGTGALGYQWRHGAAVLVDGGSISGATTATLTIHPVNAVDAGEYRADVTGGCGTATSDAATLTVPSCPADFDENGSIEPADVSRFVTVWFVDLSNGTTLADFDGNGAVEPADISLFVATWFTALNSGC